jgi:ribonuclease HI
MMAVCNLLWCTWTERNKLKFDGLNFNAQRFKDSFILSFKDSASIVFMPCSSRPSPQAFALLGLSPLRSSAPKFIPVCWTPPPIPWIKVNTDGSFRSPNTGGFGGIFRDSESNFMGAFAFNVEVPSAIDAKILAIMEAIRVALVKRWTHVWIETDSTLVIKYFNSPSLIPWRLKIAWLNCIHLARQINIRISHIFREGNTIADKLANYGAVNEGSIWWRMLPGFLRPSFGNDLESRISYRFR